ncbi:methyltransferase domain-containing protein [Sphingomonas sp. Y38-1Y]|uniref:methyltransferase domain-containing protein n=1 Tax=Sphingomonas sp. Y38-1Y TaxID=3078265 RepID=UPI0028E61012|nr:methyltransferase domain-containing protein [Sphingomonas sp. Y38-1Y]
MHAPTSYDEVAYVTAIFQQATAERAAVIARAAGFDAAPVETARVLEVGCGDALNLLAMAAAAPAGDYVGFDLAPTAIARGQALAAAAGLGQVRLEVLDILDAADALEGEFDYIVAHGVHAWVPPHVRAALVALVGAKLSARGVAFLSYNALPGGHFRRAVRDRLLHALEGVEGRQAQAERAAALLDAIVAEQSASDNPYRAAMREAAAGMRAKPWNVLAHDELGGEWHPQALSDVVAEAAANGLAYLGDAGAGQFDDAFLPDDVAPEPDTDAQLVRLLQAGDDARPCFFRNSLFVRTGAKLSRRIDHEAVRGLYASTRAERIGETSFRNDRDAFEIKDAALVAILTRLVEARPARIAVRELVSDDLRTLALFEMASAGLISLHTLPGEAPSSLPERPRAGPLVAALLAEGMTRLVTPDHQMIEVAEEAPRRLLMALDGLRGPEALARDLALDAAEVGEMLAALHRFGLVV